jgi:hypothetical protein
MFGKKFLGLLLLAVLFLLSASYFASAGCCISPVDGCTPAASATECDPTTDSFSAANCNLRGECQLVCCCANNAIKVNVTCSGDSVSNNALGVGETCSCPSSPKYSVSGTVLKAGSVFFGATVSTAGLSTVSGAGGVFTLNNVPQGATTISAQSPNCTGTATINPPLNQNIANIVISLNCACADTSCDIVNNAYCQSGSWIFYNLSKPAENISYCRDRCGDEDPADCSFNPCKANDGVCSSSCSATVGDTNYDPDCVCSAAPNGVCPAGSGCSFSSQLPNYDADCVDVISKVDCGDGTVSYPYESCEPNAIDAMSLCGPDLCQNCNCAFLSGCGDGILQANEDCEMGLLCSDGSQCGSGCKCGAQTCSNALMNITLLLSFNAPNKAINLRWVNDPACAPLVTGYDIYKCERKVASDCANKTSFTRLNLNLPPEKKNYSDIVSQNSEFGYFIQATYRNTAVPIGESSIQYQKSGSFICMDREGNTDEFCIYNKRSRCKADFNIENITGGDCSANNSFCMGPDFYGKTMCTTKGVCDLCNGLYGMFSNIDLAVSMLEEGQDVSKWCHTGFGRDVVAGCYLDQNKTFFDSFKYCANIASCYDYKSQSACMDSSDPCGKNKGCEWVWLAGSNIFGGVCRPSNPKLQNCKLCDDPKYNWVTPFCTKNSCDLFGLSCNYLGANSSGGSCSDQLSTYCTKYISDTQCTGGNKPVQVNATYLNGVRVAGNNAVIQKSLDVWSLGKCYWDYNNSRCFRNADNVPVNFTTRKGNDCDLANDYYCESDFYDPVTNIIPTTFGLYSSDVVIRYSAQDNYPSNRITTYFCIASGRCYPSETGANGEYFKRIPTSGRYNVFYYSVDPAKNLEVVNNFTILIDAEPPVIDITDPANASDIITNQAYMNVTGVVSTDAKYVCANNTVLKKVSCINNCALLKPGSIKKMDCFSNTTGVFKMSVSVGNSSNISSTRSVMFYTEDFAGNKYQNTLMGILYDINPPSEPNISIYG